MTTPGTANEWLAALAGLDCDAGLRRLYGGEPAVLTAQKNRWRTTVAAFAGAFPGRNGVALFNAPGRTEIGGNHTDHQHGCVLAGGVSLDMLAVACPNDDNVVRLVSDGAPAHAIPLGDLEPDPADFYTSGALVRGIARCFNQAGRSVGGMDMVVDSQVLVGSGLSSSAAFEILVGNAFRHLYRHDSIDAVTLAQYGQYAENVFFNKPCGLMDQLACSVGGVLFIDFLDADAPKMENVAVDLKKHGHALCILDSGADHADLSDEYATIPDEMKQVAGFFNQPYLRLVDEERLVRDIPELRRRFGDRAVLRSLHFFGENRRARRELETLRDGDFAAFLSLVKQSGASSAQYLQNAHVAGQPQSQSLSMVLALAERILGERGAVRVHGGGFAGTAQAFVPLDMLDGFIAGMEPLFGKDSCHVLSLRPVGGINVYSDLDSVVAP